MKLLKRYLLVSGLSALTILIAGIFKAWSGNCSPCYLSALVGSAIWLLIYLIINCTFFLLYIHPDNKVLKYVVGVAGSLLPTAFLLVSLSNYHGSGAGHVTEFEIMLPSAFVMLLFGSRTLFNYLEGKL